MSSQDPSLDPRIEKLIAEQVARWSQPQKPRLTLGMGWIFVVGASLGFLGMCFVGIVILLCAPIGHQNPPSRQVDSPLAHGWRLARVAPPPVYDGRDRSTEAWRWFTNNKGEWGWFRCWPPAADETLDFGSIGLGSSPPPEQGSLPPQDQRGLGAEKP